MPTFSAEYEPLDTLKTLFDDNWIEYPQTPKPQMLIVNDVDEAKSRIDLRNRDYMLIRTEAPEQIRYRGNITVYDRTFPITLDVFTKESRQRLRDLWKMMKMIIFDNKFNFTGYQLIRIMSYQEMQNEQLNVWRSQIKLQVESAGVPVESLS